LLYRAGRVLEAEKKARWHAVAKIVHEMTLACSCRNQVNSSPSNLPLDS
jgi:hypothetical protein